MKGQLIGRKRERVLSRCGIAHDNRNINYSPLLVLSVSLIVGTAATYSSHVMAQSNTADNTSAPAAPAAPAGAVSAPAKHLQDVTVTGSAIATPNAATAVPVTVYHASQLRAEGITSADQFLQQLGINNTSDNATSQNGGNLNGGASYANLRGLGVDKTLVLLNGRRVISNAYSGDGVDLNSIPFAAIDRVEVLRDSAGALYGSDAVAGVINFITRQNYQGAVISTNLSTPTHGGGGQHKTYTGTWGVGDLNKDGFNWMSTLSYSDQNELPHRARHYWENGFRPNYGSVYRNGATYQQGNSYYQQGCFGNGNKTTHGICGSNSRDWQDYASHAENTSLYSAATFKQNEHNQGQLSLFWSHNYTRFKTYSDIATFNVNPSSPVYPAGNQPGLNASQAVTANWQSPMGADIIGQSNDVKRLQYDQKGSFGGWTYDSAVAYNHSTSRWRADDGFINYNDIVSQVNNGEFNPFYPATPAEKRLLAQDAWRGNSQRSTGSAYIWDGHIGHSLGDWFGAGPAQIAIGAEASHQRFAQHIYDNKAQSMGMQAQDIHASRNQEALWSEVDVPILNSLEATGSLRYDHYSQIGSTTNPKVSFRYQPLDNLVFRGSWSSAFVAPTLYDLYTPQTLTYSGNLVKDPVLCKNNSGSQCAINPRELQGGNPNLKPEKSRQWSFGFVYSPIHNLTTSADFWWYRIRNDIDQEGDQFALDHDNNVCRYGDPSHCYGNDDGGQPGTIDYFHNTLINIGKIHTNGVDLAANYLLPTSTGNWTFGLNATYTFKFDEDEGAGFRHGLGRMDDNDDAHFRWKGAANLGWSKGPWSAGLTANYISGYTDYNLGLPQYYVPHKKVASYTTFDINAGYHFKNGLAVTLGSRNILNRKPPFTAYNITGVDTRYASAFGRVIYANASYRF